jgi:low affinity Fe/Cu permease
MFGRGVRTVFDGPKILGRRENALGEEKPGCELSIRARRAHDDRERLAVQAYFKRLFCGGAIGTDLTDAVAYARHINGPKCLYHGGIVPTVRALLVLPLHWTERMADRARGAWLLGRLEAFCEGVTEWAGSSMAFFLALATLLVWLLLGPIFRFSDTWQLVINTATTIVTFLMVFLIQRTQNKEALAIHLKLNEIVAALEGASNRLIEAERLSEEDLRQLEQYYRELAQLAAKQHELRKSHSVEEARSRHGAKARAKKSR